MSLDNLPVEWFETTLEQIAEWGSGGTPSRKNSSYYGGDVPWIKTGDLGEKYVTQATEFITDEAVKNSSAKFFKKGSVIMAMYGATIGKTSILGVDATTNQACAVGTPIATSTEFLYYFLRNEKNSFIAKGKGGAQPNISQQIIKAHTIYLPSLAEQQEIVRQLDSMLAQVEQIKARLDAIPTILKKFRQSVLESYFNNLASVQQVNLDDLVVSIDQGWSPKCLNTPASAEQWGVIKTSAIQPLYFDASENKELPSNLKPREALSLISGDVLITRAGPRARCGVTCIVDKDYDNLMICDKVYRVRCDSKKISADYLNLYLNSLTGLSLIEKMKTGSSESGMNLTQSKFKELVIPLVSLKQQLAFAKDIKKFFQLANHIEETVQSAQKRVNLLTQSILAKAFSGELTTEWREQHQELITGINSAESLLAKIQAEREASKPVKKAKKVK